MTASSNPISSRVIDFFLKNGKPLLWVLGGLVLYFLVFHNLTLFPAPWFDEGSHLHVPKTLVKYGVYADISSEGFRYYGPTIGVGPTVMLPIAAAFKLFGIGLLQARMVMALYLLAALFVFYRLAENLAGKWTAWIALALLVSSRSVLILEYGRQLLGEIPGLFFMLLALYLWFSRWNRIGWGRLGVIGVLFGLAMITKYQYLLFLAPALVLSWLLNIFYYKTASHRDFLVPGIIAAGSFGLWQLFTLFYLGPATLSENLALLRASAEGAAFNFDLGQMAANLGQLVSRATFLWALLPALVFGFFLSRPNTPEGQKWNVIFLLTILNLGWYVTASIGWLRYAFLGFGLSSLFVASMFKSIIVGIKLEWGSDFFRSLFKRRNALRLAAVLWLAAIILLPLGKTVIDIAFPAPPYARQMAEYLDANIPSNAVIETWDPEMGFLSDHNYHYPPNALLAVAVDQVYYGGESVHLRYNYVQTEQPGYVLLGEFSKWTGIFPYEDLMGKYELVHSVGDYDLYRLIK